MNKSDGHQMSLAVAVPGPLVSCGVWGWGGVPVHMGTLPCGQTRTFENITFPQLRWRAVNIYNRFYGSEKPFGIVHTLMLVLRLIHKILGSQIQWYGTMRDRLLVENVFRGKITLESIKKEMGKRVCR